MNTTNKYIGNLHQDAEISMDLEEGIICMNYSSLSNDYNSNCIEYKFKFKQNRLIFIFYSLFVQFTIVFLRSFLFHINKIAYKLFSKTYKKYNIQYVYQKILKNIAYSLDGIVTETFEGDCFSRFLIVPIRTNLFVEYNLNEDYQKYIKKISFKRRIVQIETPVWKSTQQLGWNMIFEFSEIPKQGSAILKYIK